MFLVPQYIRDFEEFFFCQIEYLRKSFKTFFLRSCHSLLLVDVMCLLNSHGTIVQHLLSSLPRHFLFQCQSTLLTSQLQADEIYCMYSIKKTFLSYFFFLLQIYCAKWLLLKSLLKVVWRDAKHSKETVKLHQFLRKKESLKAAVP